MNGSLLDDMAEFQWDFDTSLNGNFLVIHAAVFFQTRIVRVVVFCEFFCSITVCLCDTADR